ncbi:transcription factor TFIIF complex subunit Tfg3 [Ciborinia camelliae]|nr:transcription factor TFIIF complex subunit Tfg3 [Ciborinia camelliae]
MVADIKRTIKLITEQRNIDKPALQEGFPMKSWNIEIYMLDEAGNEKPATAFTKAIYNLHPTFPNPTQKACDVLDLTFATQTVFTEPPFRCENEGWGEFDMTIDLFTTPTGGKHSIAHDLNFSKTRYEARHQITFKNPSRELISALRETGPVPGDENGGMSRKKDSDGKKRKRTGQVDMEKLAEGLVKLQEDDLLHVVQMIHDNKTDETYTKNDVDGKLAFEFEDGRKKEAC